MNSVKMGQPKEFYRNSGCVIISNGCPCPPIAVDEIISGSGPTPPVILAPGSVSNIQVEYGSVIVTWNAPTEGGPPTSYTVSAIPPPGGTTITVTGVPTTTYSFATGALDAGTVYEMSVIGVNAAGNGPTSSPSSPISGPYSAASGVSTSITTPNTISINFSAYDFDRGLPPTQYTIIQYVNGTKTSTTIGTYTTTSIIVNNGLNGTDLYSFQFQLSRPVDNKYTSYTSLTTPTRIYPAGPTNINYSDYSTTSVKINYENFLTDGYDLTGATCTITNGTTTLSIQANSLTNTSVIVERLSPATTYANYTISFSKSPYNTSAASSLTTFIANGIAPSNIQSNSFTTTTSYTTFNTYNSTNPGEFDFGMGGVILSIPNVPSPSITVVSFSAINIGNLSAGTTYNGCTMTLTNQTGVRSDPSAPFTIVTRSTPPFNVTVSSTTDTTASCAIGAYSGFTGPITEVKAYNNTSNPQYEELSVAPYTPGSDTFTITGLLQSTPYEVVITVSNGTYTSVYSNPFQFTTRVSPITGILAVYGTSGTDVTWNAPTTGGIPASYTITATSNRGSTPVVVTGITTNAHSFTVADLTSSDLYDISVIGVNVAGDGLPPLSVPSIYAPYSAPTTPTVRTSATEIPGPGLGKISITLPTYDPFNETSYVLTVIINGMEQTTKIRGDISVNPIILDSYNGSPLIGSNSYSFILQLVKISQNLYSALSSTTSPVYIFPAGPTILNPGGISNITTTTVQINYNNFSTTGYDLTGATCTITNGTNTLSIQAGSLTNTSVIVEGLSSATTYDNYTIKFSKSPYNDSAASSLTTFYTYGPALSNVTYSSNGTDPTTTHIQCNYSNYIAAGGFSLVDPPAASIVAMYGSTQLNYQNITNTTFSFINLSTSTVYSNVQLTLYNTPYRSVTFTLPTFTTSSEAPTGFNYVNLADTPVTFTFNPYSPFTSGVTTITFFATKNSTESVTIPCTVINNQSVTISALDLEATYTEAYIIIYNGQITSLRSNEIASFRMPYSNTQITVTSTKTCRTQQLEFSYGFFTPTGAVIVAPSGVTVSGISGSQPTYDVTLENLTPNTTYSTIKIQFTGGNPGDISQYSNVPSFTTPPIEIGGTITNLSVGNVTTTTIQMTFNPFTSFGITSAPPTNAIVTTSNGGVITTYSATFDTANYDKITISSLAPGQQLSNPTIILTDATNCFQSNPATYEGNIRTYYNSPTNVVIGSITQDTVVVNFTFSSFTPSAAPYTSVIREGFSDLTVSTVTSSSVTITDLTVGTTYSDYQLQLGNSIGESAEAVTIPNFTPQWPAPTHVASAPDGSFNTQAIITYLDYSPTFGASNGTLSGISGGIITNVTNGGFTIYNLSPGTLYSQGSFFLTNNDSPPLDTGSASIPEFITNGGPNTPTSIQVVGVTTDSASITFSQYGFTPAQIICETYTGGEFISVTVDSDQSATLTGLAYPRGYNVKIRVIYNDQTSQWSSPFSFST
jgi:hypothetical protein